MDVRKSGNNITAKIKAHFEKYSAFPTEIFDNEYDRKFVDSKRIREFISRALDADIKRVYRVYSTQADDYALGTGNRPMTLDISGDTFYIVTKSGKITEMTNSEWGQLRIADNLKD